MFPLRIWVIDNSGSMITGDGHKLVANALGRGRQGLEVRVVQCARFVA